MSRVPLGFMALGLWVLAGPVNAQSLGADNYAFGIQMMILSLCLVPGLYFLPSILAATRDHPAANRIFIINLLLGWTVVGWAVALIWVLKMRTQVVASASAQAAGQVPKLTLIDGLAQEIEDLARQKLQLQLSDDEYNQRRQAILDRWKADSTLATPQRL